MNRRPGYSKEVRERAVRLVLTGEHDHSSRWAAIQSVASKIGCTPETLRSWVKKMEVEAGTQPGITTNQSQRTKELERGFQNKSGSEFLFRRLNCMKTLALMPTFSLHARLKQIQPTRTASTMI